MKRPFWIHQFVEYLLGIGMLAVGLQSAEPGGPSLAAAVILINAGIADGPLGAWHLVKRPLHGKLDYVLAGLLIVFAIFGGSFFDSTGRVTVIGLALVWLFIAVQSDFSPKKRKERISAEGGRAAEVGRMAGRATGNAINFGKAVTRRRDTKQ